jgi:hypothetical protein
MNLLMVGGGQSDTWVIRGQQLGRALGARCTANPTAADWAWADLAVLVKRGGFVWGSFARAAKVPIVWDPIDFWKQPGDNGLPELDARALLAQAIEQVRPVLTIGATDAMAEACDGAYLPHHSWIGLTPTPARETVAIVAYQGNPHFLGSWARHLEATCRTRGWRFLINPPDVRAADLLVALREGIWDGWMCREWKSGVKVVNAICAGRPLITQHTAAMRELEAAGSVVETVDELSAALDEWRDLDRRQAVVAESERRTPQFTVEALAAQYRAILAGCTETSRSYANG